MRYEIWAKCRDARIFVYTLPYCPQSGSHTKEDVAFDISWPQVNLKSVEMDEDVRTSLLQT